MGAVFGIFAGFYFWAPKIVGGRVDETLAQIHFWTFFLGVNLTFAPRHFLGMSGLPRRIPDYPDAYAPWNWWASVGSRISMASVLVFMLVVYRLFLNPQPVGENPWYQPRFFESPRAPQFGMTTATSLEYAIESPTPFHAFNVLPVQA
jgi:cytochrome c oxidase subunit 1